MSGGKLIASILNSYGVDSIFTLCGGHISPILVESEKLGIKVIDTRQEETAAFAADAYARVSGNIGVAAVTAGPGITNTITALKNAQMSYTPMILLGGATATILKGRGALQDIDQESLVKPHVKYFASIKYSFQIPFVFKKAFEECKKGLPGPVFIELPVDLLYPEELVRDWYLKDLDSSKNFIELKELKKLVHEIIESDKLSSKIFSKIFNKTKKKGFSFYLKAYLDLQFAGSKYLKPIKLKQSEVDFKISSSCINECLKLIENSKRPIILIGPQINYYSNRMSNVTKFLEQLSFPVYLTGGARGLLGKNCTFQFYHKRSKALKEADVVVLLGVAMDFRLNYGQVINKSAKIISCNLSKKDLLLNRKPTVAIQAQPFDLLEKIYLKFINKKIDLKLGPWKRYLKVLNEKREIEIIEESLKSTKLVNPLYSFFEIKKFINDKALIVADGGDYVGTGAYVIKPAQPMSWLDPGTFGTLGVGGGFSIGAYYGLINKNSYISGDIIWLIYGDGASGYSLIEFETFAKFKIPVIAVIGNDASWAQIAREQVTVLGSDVATNLPRTNYHLLAKSLGGEGFVVRKNSEVNKTLKLATGIAKEGKPVLINLILEKSKFREGSISI
jgi:acetolactate synthase-like protein